MHFSQPYWLLAGVIAGAALIWRYRRFDARQQAELAKFASTNLIARLTASVSPARRRVKRALVVTGIFLLSAALARPVAGFHWEETRRKGLDLVFAVDTSKSMLAQDVKPDRLTRAKMAVEDLLGKADGDRVGLVAFAGNAFLQCPLTLDYDAFRQALDALDAKIIPRGGTDIAAAIHETEAALENNGNNERILILLTDGEDLEGSALNAARAAAKRGLKIFTVGIGSAGGELIPQADETGATQFLRDSSGQYVRSRLDETMLRQIAEAAGGMYQPLGRQAQGLETIYQQGLASFGRREVASRMQKVYLERLQWPLALGLFCLTLERLLGIRRRTATTRLAAAPQSRLVMSWNKIARPSPSAAATAAALVLLAAVRPAQASVGSAEEAFQHGDYAQAEQEYRQAATKRPGQPVLQFNHGAAAYKAGQFAPAAQSFGEGLKTPDPKLREDNYYNLGNTQYRLGQQIEKTKPDQTIKTWEQAVQSYEAALKIQQEDGDAKYNRDFVKRRIEELKKQQQQQQKQQQQQQQQNQNQQKQDQKEQSQQNDQQKESSKQNQNHDQNQSHDQQEQPDDKSNSGSGQQSKPDAKNDRGQDKQNHPEPQAGSNQDPSKQQANNNQPQAGQDHGTGQRDQKDPAGQKPEPKDQNASEQRKPDPSGSNGQPQARNPQPANDGRDQADARPEPGKMSREEARQLLDSLKGDDRQMPLAPSARGGESARNDAPVKDW